MVKTVSYSLTVKSSLDNVLSIISSPKVFIPLWPYLTEYREHEGTHTVILQLKRFGFAMKVEYTISVSYNEKEGSYVYTGKAPAKFFAVSAKAQPTNQHVKLTIEVTYSGEYERFSKPLLEEFAENLAKRVAKLAEAKVSPRPAAKPLALDMPDSSKLVDPSFLLKVMTSSKMETVATVDLSSETLGKLVEDIVSKSVGRTLYVKLESEEGGGVARLLIEDGRITGVALEVGEEVLLGAKALEALPGLAKGRWRLVVSQLTSE